MKKQSIQTIARKFFLGSLMAAAMFLSVNAANASSHGTIDASKVEVKYTGVDKYNLLSFKVKYSNPSGNTFSLTVLDENGDQLYRGFYGDKQFDKTFKLPKSEVSKVSFVIEDSRDAVKEKFDVNIKTKEVEDVVVSKG